MSFDNDDNNNTNTTINGGHQYSSLRGTTAADLEDYQIRQSVLRTKENQRDVKHHVHGIEGLIDKYTEFEEDIEHRRGDFEPIKMGVLRKNVAIETSYRARKCMEEELSAWAASVQQRDRMSKFDFENSERLLEIAEQEQAEKEEGEQQQQQQGSVGGGGGVQKPTDVAQAASVALERVKHAVAALQQFGQKMIGLAQSVEDNKLSMEEFTKRMHRDMNQVQKLLDKHPKHNVETVVSEEKQRITQKKRADEFANRPNVSNKEFTALKQDLKESQNLITTQKNIIIDLEEQLKACNGVVMDLTMRSEANRQENDELMQTTRDLELELEERNNGVGELVVRFNRGMQTVGYEKTTAEVDTADLEDFVKACCAADNPNPIEASASDDAAEQQKNADGPSEASDSGEYDLLGGKAGEILEGVLHTYTRLYHQLRMRFVRASFFWKLHRAVARSYAKKLNRFEKERKENSAANASQLSELETQLADKEKSVKELSETLRHKTLTQQSTEAQMSNLKDETLGLTLENDRLRSEVEQLGGSLDALASVGKRKDGAAAVTKTAQCIATSALVLFKLFDRVAKALQNELQKPGSLRREAEGLAVRLLEESRTGIADYSKRVNELQQPQLKDTEASLAGMLERADGLAKQLLERTQRFEKKVAEYGQKQQQREGQKQRQGEEGAATDRRNLILSSPELGHTIATATSKNDTLTRSESAEKGQKNKTEEEKAQDNEGDDHEDHDDEETVFRRIYAGLSLSGTGFPPADASDGFLAARARTNSSTAGGGEDSDSIDYALFGATTTTAATRRAAATRSVAVQVRLYAAAPLAPFSGARKKAGDLANSTPSEDEEERGSSIQQQQQQQQIQNQNRTYIKHHQQHRGATAAADSGIAPILRTYDDRVAAIESAFAALEEEERCRRETEEAATTVNAVPAQFPLMPQHLASACVATSSLGLPIYSVKTFSSKTASVSNPNAPTPADNDTSRLGDNIRRLRQQEPNAGFLTRQPSAGSSDPRPASATTSPPRRVPHHPPSSPAARLQARPDTAGNTISTTSAEPEKLGMVMTARGPIRTTGSSRRPHTARHTRLQPFHVPKPPSGPLYEDP